VDEIQVLSAQQLRAHGAQFIALLQDAVDSGASVGFLPPLAEADARAYWMSVAAGVAGGTHLVLAAVVGGVVQGTVQLALAAMPNARHRAEVMKLLVHRAVRRRGIGRALMLAVERAARGAGRTLLVLDTRPGDAAERLYASLGYVRVGIIPGYAQAASGPLADTVVMYRHLDSHADPGPQ